MVSTFRTVLAGAWLLLAGQALASGPVLVVNDTNAPPYTTPGGRGFLDAVATEAFRRAGVTLRLVKLPPARGLVDANAGTTDGDLTRIEGLDAQYPNLVRVPEKLIDWEFAAFSKTPTVPARQETLRARPVGHIRGWKIYEHYLADAPYVVTANDPQQLFRQLQKDRIEFALYERWLGLSLLREQGIRDVHALSPSIRMRGMYIYLHARHAALAPKIAEALRQIKAEGLYERLFRERVLSVMTLAER